MKENFVHKPEFSVCQGDHYMQTIASNPERLRHGNKEDKTEGRLPDLHGPFIKHMQISDDFVYPKHSNGKEITAD